MAQGKAFDKEKALKVLEPYFKLKYSRTKACEAAGINNATLSRWEKKDPTLSTIINGWQSELSAAAVLNVQEKILKGDTEQSKWWLERREKKDYSTRTDITSGDEPVQVAIIAYGKEGKDKPKTN